MSDLRPEVAGLHYPFAGVWISVPVTANRLAKVGGNRVSESVT